MEIGALEVCNTRDLRPHQVVEHAERTDYDLRFEPVALLGLEAPQAARIIPVQGFDRSIKTYMRL